jgi:hypothetical protein
VLERYEIARQRGIKHRNPVTRMRLHTLQKGNLAIWTGVSIACAGCSSRN